MGIRELVILLLPFVVAGIAIASLFFDKHDTDIEDK